MGQLDKNKQVIIEKYSYLVHRIAKHLLTKMPRSVLFEDLVQAGMVGLLEAACNYDEKKGQYFEPFASIRIRGAMIDEVRRGDWIPRSVHRSSREVTEVVHQIEQTECRDAKDKEVAKAMGLTIKEYDKLLLDMANRQVIALGDMLLRNDESTPVCLKDERTISPDDSVESLEVKDCLTRMIEQLPKNEGLVLALYYDEELNLREIGEVMGVSESRVCQLHSQAMNRLQVHLDELR